MIYPFADKLEEWGSKYALVTLAAKRAKQIKSGAPSTVNTDSRNPLTIALEEIAAGKITCSVPDEDIVLQTMLEPEVAELLAIPKAVDEEVEAVAEAAPVAEDETILSTDEEVQDEWEEEVEEEEVEEDEPVLIVDDDLGDLDLERPVVTLDDAEEGEAAPKRRGRRKASSDVEATVDVDVDIEPDIVDIADEVEDTDEEHQEQEE